MEQGEKYTDIQTLIENGLEKNKEKIQKESFHLSSYEKEDFYNYNKRTHAAGLALLNIFYGLGSYIQGDILIGVIQSVLVGASMIMNDDMEKGNNKSPEWIYITMGSSLTIGFIAPFIYQSKYNKTLKRALNINDDYDVPDNNNFSYSIDPLIVPRDGAPAVGLSFNLHY